MLKNNQPVRAVYAALAVLGSATIGLWSADSASARSALVQASEGDGSLGAVASSGATDYRARLNELRNVQTRSDIGRIVRNGGPSQLLVDSRSGEVLAAIALPLRALSSVGPGCSGISLCMCGGSPYGYTGSGSLSSSWKSIASVSAGDRQSAFVWNGAQRTYGAYATAHLTSPVTITKIQRW